MSLIRCSIINLFLISSIFGNGILDDHKTLIFEHCSSQKLDGDEDVDARNKLFEKLHFQSFYSKVNSTFVMVDDESESSFSGFFQCRQDLDQRRCNECMKAFRNVSKALSLCGNSMAGRIQLSGCQVQYESDKYNAIFSLDEELKHNKCGEKQYIISTHYFHQIRSKAFDALESEIGGGQAYNINGFYSIKHEGFHVNAQCEVGKYGIDECKCAKCLVEAVELIQDLPDCENSIDGQLFLGLCYLTYHFNPHDLPHDQDNNVFHLGQPGASFGKVAAIAIGSVVLLFVVFMLLRCLKKKDDAWIGGLGTGKLITPVRLLDENATVETIMDPITHTWRRDVIAEIFFPIDVERIMQIPINVAHGSDERVWAGSINGLFNVRDAYNLAIRHYTEGSSSNGVDPVWKKLWSLQIQPKAKMFLWRAMWDILPNSSNLRRKGIDVDGKCVRCGLNESTNHVLRDCGWAAQVWQQMQLSSDTQQHIMNFREWFSLIMQQKDRSVVELFGVTAWQIWCARNELLFDKLTVSPELCFKKASNMLEEYRRATASVLMDREGRRDARWAPPDRDSVKINVDAAVNTQDDKVGLGVVARNADGVVLAAASKTQWPFISVERSDIEAIQWALEIIKDHQWKNVVIEGDAQNVIKALQRQISRSFHNQVLIDNILAATVELERVSFTFCFREANNVAHRLAKWASSGLCSSVWLNGGPFWIADSVLSDLR